MNKKKTEEFYPIRKKMIIKKILLMMRRNSMTLLGAALLASATFYVINNPEIFMASILSLQEQQFIKEKGRDIAYKTNEGYVDIFVAEHLPLPKHIDFTISFDPTTVNIAPEQLSGQGTRSYNSPEEGMIIIRSFPGTTINTTESVIMLPFTGEQKDILLSEAISNGKGLSIGSLNELNLHSE